MYVCIRVHSFPPLSYFLFKSNFCGRYFGTGRMRTSPSYTSFLSQNLPLSCPLTLSPTLPFYLPPFSLIPSLSPSLPLTLPPFLPLSLVPSPFPSLLNSSLTHLLPSPPFFPSLLTHLLTNLLPPFPPPIRSRFSALPQSGPDLPEFSIFFRIPHCLSHTAS